MTTLKDCGLSDQMLIQCKLAALQSIESYYAVLCYVHKPVKVSASIIILDKWGYKPVVLKTGQFKNM